MNFIDIVNIIFENKYKYKEISEKDKIDGFFKINQKFLLNKKLFNICNSFNNKSCDKASAIDLYNIYFKNVHKTPGWYWTKSPLKKVNTKVKKISNPDKQLLIENFQLTEIDLDFLITNFKDDVDYELKILKRFK